MTKGEWWVLHGGAAIFVSVVTLAFLLLEGIPPGAWAALCR